MTNQTVTFYGREYTHEELIASANRRAAYNLDLADKAIAAKDYSEAQRFISNAKEMLAAIDENDPEWLEFAIDW